MTTTSPSDWLQQLYQSTDVIPQSSTATPTPPSTDGGRFLSDSTVVTTTMDTGNASSSSPSNNIINYPFVHLQNLDGGGDGGGGVSVAVSGNSISAENSQTSSIAITQTGSASGRVTKPARKRTRASRKNPTTLLNTDTKNFRAMVQRFTGGGVSVGSDGGVGGVTTGSGGGGGGYSIPAALYSSGFGLGGVGGGAAGLQLQGQIGNYNQLQQGSGSGGSSMMGMHYQSVNPSVGGGGSGINQYSSLQLHHHPHHQLLPMAQQLYTFPNSSTAEISTGSGLQSRDMDRGVTLGRSEEDVNPTIRTAGQVGISGSDYSSSTHGVGQGDGGGGGGGGDAENNNSSTVRRFMF